MAPLRSDDEAVIEAAMLSFYPKSDWNTSDWNQGDFVVVRPNYGQKGRPNFLNMLTDCAAKPESWPKESIKKHSKQYQKAKKTARMLRDLVKRIQVKAQKHEPGQVPNLMTLNLDSRIVLKDVERTRRFMNDLKVKNSEGKEGTLRVLASISPAGYSSDGQFAALEASVPWSMHHAVLTFFLERTESGWKVIHVDTAIFF